MISGVLNRTATQININADCKGATSVIHDRTINNIEIGSG
jgi:hypothetical protein